MGYSLSWVAVKGRTDSEIHQSLGLKKTGRHGDYGKQRIVGRMLKKGWYIIIAQGCDDPITRTKTMAMLSKGCEAVACSIEEHVMFSSCAFWKKGKKTWSVTHRGDEGPLDIVKTGKPPESCALLERELIEAQKKEDNENESVDHVFDLPLVMAKQLVGFRHDEEVNEPEDGVYEVLELNYQQRITRAVKAILPWAYLLGVLLLVVAIMTGFAEVARWLLDWLFKLVKDFVS